MKKKIKIFRRISFLDIDKSQISQDAQNLLDSYLLAYTDANPAMQEDLYIIDDAFATLLDSKVPATIEGVAEIVALQTLAVKKKAAYIRLVVQ